MSRHKPRESGLWGRFAALPNDSPAKMVIVAVTVCLVCSVMVSTAAVMLRPVQERNQDVARKQEILKVADLYTSKAEIDEAFAAIETRIVDLQTGQYADEVPEHEREARIAIPAEQDIAGIGEHPRYLPVYLVREAGAIKTVVLPIYGKGLWSTMHAFVALSGDGATVQAVSFYDHAETPGLGGEISNPSWLAKWVGKQVRDPEGNLRLAVIKGRPDPASPQAVYQIDGLSGATLTANGVTDSIQYWLGEAGFGPYLARLRAQGG